MKKLILINLLLLIVAINVNAQEIFEAIRANDQDKVKTLIENDKEVVKLKTHYGDTPLHMAGLVDNEEIAKILIEHGADLNALNGSLYTPLMRAGLKVTKLLVENGADINIVTSNGQLSALNIALMWKEKDVAEYLLKCGARIPDKENPQFKMNLIGAAKKGIIQYLEKCLRDGLSPLYAGESQSNLFHYAAENNSVELLDKLFSLGVPFDRANIYGWTPLHNAAYYGNQVTVEWFIKKGADVNRRTTDGNSPYNLAVEANKKDVISYLQAIRADQSPQQFPELTGDYLGQRKPGRDPVPFAPGIISAKHRFHSTIAFSKDGDEAFWGFPDILFSSRKNDKWTRPDTTSLIEKGDAPFFSPDGKRLYFVAQVGERMWEKEAIGFVERRNSGWSEFKLLPDIINRISGIHFAASVDQNGNLYFGARQGGTVISRIYFSEYLNGAYSEPQIMEHLKNIDAYSPYIAPDGNYLVYTSKDLGLMVSFRKGGGGWTEGQSVLKSEEYPYRCPIVSHDGKFLFFLRYVDDRYIPYWVDAKIIEDLKPKELKLGAQDILTGIQKGDIETVRAILKVNYDLARTSDRWGRTTLHFAVDMNNAEIIELLIRSGADVEATDIYAYTPLFRAIDRGKKEAAEALINNGADVNHGMEDGFMAVHLAASIRNARLLELLLEKGADRDAHDRYGLTPLHIAAAYGFGDVVELLISHKADMNEKSIDGGSPVHFARAGGHLDIAHLILSKGANSEPRKYPAFKGKYLGFKGPGPKAETFLPGVLMHLNPPHSGLAISPDAKEIYWAETSIKYDLYGRIWFMREVDGSWTPPQIAPFSNRYLDNYPSFSVDGKRLFFSSNRPLDEKMEPKDSNIWFVEKAEEGWSQPNALGSSVNTDQDEATPTVDKDGTLYFSRAGIADGKFGANIYRSRFLDGQYQESEKLEETVNSPTTDAYPYIAPDGSYLIYSTGRYGIGFQLCISFLKKDGSWTQAKPIKELLDPRISWCQGISLEGRYLFFAGHENGVWNIFWMDAGIIEDLKPRELKSVRKP